MKYKNIFLIGGVLILMAFQIVVSSKAKSRANLLIDKYKNVVSLGVSSVYKEYELISIGESLPDTIHLLTESNTFLPDEVLRDSNTLVFYFSTEYCDMCFRTQLEAIRMVFDDKTDKIVIMASSVNYKDILIYKDQYDLKCPVYKVEDYLFPALDTIGSPYFLMLDKNKKVINAFVPLKERMAYTFIYLRSAKRYLYPDLKPIYTSGLENLDFDHETLYLGDVKMNEEIKYKINVFNHGDDNLLLNIISDCDCTTLEDERLVIRANASSVIKASLTVSEEGPFQKFLYVQIYGSDSFRTIEIKGVAVR